MALVYRLFTYLRRKELLKKSFFNFNKEEKIMKRLLIIMASFALVFADSPEGQWKLSGLRVDYFDIAREDGSLVVQDAYGFGISVPVASFPAGALFNVTVNGPFTNQTLGYAGVNLNVNLYPNGTGAIGEGSYYPDVETGTLPDGSSDCITTGKIFPITDDFNWDAPAELDGAVPYPATNILGLPSANSHAGQAASGLGVNGSGVFDNWPANPVHIATPPVLPAIATADAVLAVGPAGACMTPAFDTDGDNLPDATLADMNFGGDAATCISTVAAAGAGQVPGMSCADFGTCLPGTWGGMYKTGSFDSQMGQDLETKFLLEWNAIDGWESESGLGDDLTVDEDGDGTDYDRIFGVPYISSTYVNSTNPLCDISGGALTGAGAGLAHPVAGDIVGELGGDAAVGALVTGSCLQGVADGAYDSCIGQVADGVNGLCEEAGGPVNAVTGLCFEASQSDDFSAACAYYGAAGALVGTCLELGFDAETCNEAAAQAMPAVEAYCVYATGYDCATAGIDECAVLTDPTFSAGLCGTLAGALTTSETCYEWTASFDESWLDAQATAVVGASCTDFAAGLQAGLAAGDATAIATIDGLFAGVAGMSCTDYGNNYVGMCIEGVSGANTMYLMDPSLSTWGMFLTYNAASVQQYQAAGYSIETIAYYFPELFVNDSGTDFDPSCYYTGAPCGGRLLMAFAPTCVDEVEAHQIVAEFVDLDALNCDGTGDVAGGYDDVNGNGCADCDGYANSCEGYSTDPNSESGLDCYEGAAGDGILNVVDIIKLIGHILGTDPLGGLLLCEADMSGDGIVNVVDVVAMVNAILGGGLSSANDSKLSEATITYDNNSISISSIGNVNAIDMTVQFKTEKFDLEINSDYIGDYTVNGKTAHIVITGFDPLKNEIITINNGTVSSINGDAANMQGLISLRDGGSDALPQTAEVSAAYPNPFNPSTSFNMELSAEMDVTVKVFNLTGQLVDVIANGQLAKGEHTFTWDASNVASGAYFITTQSAHDLNTQKVMLIK